MVDHEAAILIDFARLLLKAGDRTGASRFAADARLITDRCGYALQGADAYLLLAQIDYENGNFDYSREHATKAKGLAECDGPPDSTYRVAYDEALALITKLRPAKQ